MLVYFILSQLDRIGMIFFHDTMKCISLAYYHLFSTRLVKYMALLCTSFGMIVMVKIVDTGC